MKFNRAMRRKAEKEWTHEQYVARKKAEIARNKVDRAMIKAKAVWVEKINSLVPKWAIWIALRLFPKWLNVLINNLPSEKYAIKVVRSKWPYWRKALNLWPMAILRIIIINTIVKPLLFVRSFFRTLGTKSSFKKIKNNNGDEVIRMKIYHWFVKIYQQDWILE